MGDGLITLFDHLALAAKAIHDAARDIVIETTEEVHGRAQAGAPYATGFMSHSCYRMTAKESTYGEGGSSGDKGSYLVPQVEAPANDQEGIVATGANYSIYVELGTRYMAAQPWLLPAAEGARALFMSEFETIGDRIGGLLP